MTPQETPISVIDPISPAIERVKTILFRPFDLGKWFVIGFCAWLACLGSGGVPNFNFPGEALDNAKDFIITNLYWILPLVIIVVLLIIALIVLLTWLSSRGHFMFLHCVALNKDEVKVPWRKFKKQGNSLFLFRIVLFLISFAVIMLLVAMLAVISVLLFAGDGHSNLLAIIFRVLFKFCFILPTVIVFTLIKKFTLDFVVPVMFLRGTTCTTAWREFWPLLVGNKGKFALYILFQIVILLAVGIIVIAGVCITCCCLGCILAIPYISTVLLLPILVFKRSYTLLYFRQYGPSFDVFSTEPAVA